MNILVVCYNQSYTTFLASIMFFHSITKAQHREPGKHLSTIIGGIYLLSLQLDSIYTTQRDNSFINTSSQSPRTRLDTYCINMIVGFVQHRVAGGVGHCVFRTRQGWMDSPPSTRRSLRVYNSLIAPVPY